MQAVSNPPRTIKHLLQPARIAMLGAWSLPAAIRRFWPRGRTSPKGEPEGDASVLQDAHISMRCGNPGRSWRVLSEWLMSRGDRPEDFGWLSANISNWQDGSVMARLTEARVARLLALRRSAEALKVAVQRLRLDPRFRPSSAADTLSLAQLAARGGAPRVAGILLSDFGARFSGDPRVAVSEALKRRLTEPTPVRLQA